jgi:serine/threonine-protein kinase
MNVPVERLVEGRYRLDRLLGRGGMGAVYLAHDSRLNRDVAVKVMVGNLFGNQNALRRFEREALTSARIAHPNVVRIYDFGRLSGGGAFLVIEYVSGSSWRQRLREGGRMTPAQCGPWFEQLLNGLEAAHAFSIIHRDLKPENVLVSEERLKILDFGLARLRTSDAGVAESVTIPGAILGTVAYMSPEQLSGSEVDARTDLFSVGIMLVESLTGRTPFRGRSFTDQLQILITRRFTFQGRTLI